MSDTKLNVPMNERLRDAIRQAAIVTGETSAAFVRRAAMERISKVVRDDRAEA